MTSDRYKELMNNYELKLTDNEIKEGWIFCNCEWDGLLIHKSDPESQFCTCLRNKNE